MALEGFLPAWDVEKRRADIASIVQWTLSQVRAMGYAAENLESLYRVMTPEQARAAAKTLGHASLAPELRQVLHRAIRQAIPELPVNRVWIQTYAHYRILLPDDDIAPVPPHSDYGFGHFLSERNVWIPLTDVEGDAALHILPFAASMAFMSQSRQLHGVFEDLPEMRPVPMQVGEVLLFTPLHIHRGRKPHPQQCRVSIDIRLVPRAHASPDMTFSPLRDDP